MIATLAVPFRDARAADLGFALAIAGSPAPRPALAVLAIDLGATQLELRILGGSHEVRVHGDGLALAEVVACDPPGQGVAEMPPCHDAAAGGGRYRFRSATDRPGPAELRALARGLGERLGSSSRGLVGRFPGHASALTALEAWPEPTGVGWRTWHVYPEAGEVVRTQTTVARR